MNNTIHGKTMENLRHRTNIKLLNNKKDYLKCTWKQAICGTKYSTTIQSQ